MVGIKFSDNPHKEDATTRKAIAESVDHIAFIRAFEISMGHCTEDEFDEMVNEECAKAYEKYADKSAADLIIIGLKNVAEIELRNELKQE